MFRFALLLLFLPTLLLAQIELKEAYPVAGVQFRYEEAAADLPKLNGLYTQQVTLMQEGLIWGAPVGEGIVRTFTFDHLSQERRLFSKEGLTSLAHAIVQYFERQGLIGVYVSVDSAEIDLKGVDRRSDDHDTLTFVITMYRVGEVNTVVVDAGSGERAVNLPRFYKVIEESPIQAGAGVEVSTLLRKELLDEYVYFLNRYPGRRVDILLTGANEEGRVNLDYVVSEEKPWRLYANVLNSGSRSDNRFVERFGFIHHQLFGKDLIAALDYATTDFDGFHFVRGYLEGALPVTQSGRWFLEGMWSEFTSSEFGIFDDEFTGLQDGVTAGLKFVVFQWRDLFVDLVTSLNWRYIKSDNKLLAMEGSSEFLLPRIGLALERIRHDSVVVAHLGLETNLSGLIGSDKDELDKLGRANVDADWWVMKGSLILSKFLDPRPDDPSLQHHEVSLSSELQYAFCHRLIPQMERSLGGYDTVRGYQQSTASAPNVFLSRAEYRYHYPLPEYELHTIGRLFFDAGRTMFTDREAGELDHTLVGTGFGAEAEWKKRFRFRAEIGVALNSLSENLRSAGDAFGHLSATVVY